MERLKEIEAALHAHNEVLAIARHKYLSKEAERKHRAATLIKQAEGSSHAAKETNAQASEEWLAFHTELSVLESDYQYELFKHEIMKLEHMSTYLLQKQDGDLIGRARTD